MTFPAVPLANPWPTGFIDEDDMHAFVDVPINAMANEMGTWGHDFPRLLVANAGGSAQAFNVNVTFGVVTEDTAGGWNAANNTYTVPAGGTGLWVLAVGFVQTSAVTFSATINGLPAAWHTPKSNVSGAVAASGCSIPGLPVPLTAGAVLSVQLQGPGTAPTLAGSAIATGGGASPRNYFSAMMVGHR